MGENDNIKDEAMSGVVEAVRRKPESGIAITFRTAGSYSTSVGPGEEDAQERF